MAYVLKRLKGQFPLISLAHNIIPHQNMPFDRKITNYYIRQNDAFVVLSSAVSDDLDKFDAKAKRIIVPHPVYDIFGKAVDRNEAVKVLELNPGYKYLLFFGLVKPYKGLKYLLEAMPFIKEKLPDVRLIVAGEFYEDKEKYISLIEKLGIKDRVLLFPGFIPNEQVKYFFSVADIVVQPYLSATQSGITQVAYNFEKPMIVTDVGGLREIVIDGQTGYVVPKEEPAAIANAVVKFYGSKTDFRSNVKEIKKKFSWDSFAERVLVLYDEVRDK